MPLVHLQGGCRITPGHPVWHTPASRQRPSGGTWAIPKDLGPLVATQCLGLCNLVIQGSPAFW
eukprot:14136800-Heterocapsa_arctica.AAC.1